MSRYSKYWIVIGASILLLGVQNTQANLKVYILAGQSNMEGMGFIDPAQRHLDRNGGMGTLRYCVEHDTNGTFAHLVDDKGNWAVRKDAWVYYIQSSSGDTLAGNLSPAFGGFWDTFGPELQFGHYMADFHNDQILLIKTAWGGRSLMVDFRPPGSGGTVGFYYNEIIRIVKDVLGHIGSHFPGYDGKGYDLAGFGWHQGWNDWCNDKAVAEYGTNMANFIRDIRKDLAAPALPFVIAESGMCCWDATNAKGQTFCASQTSPASLPEFKGTVAAAKTRDFYFPPDVSPADADFHWNNNGLSYFLVGNSMAEAMVRLVGKVQAKGPQSGQDKVWQQQLKMVRTDRGIELDASHQKIRSVKVLTPQGKVLFNAQGLYRSREVVPVRQNCLNFIAIETENGTLLKPILFVK